MARTVPTLSGERVTLRPLVDGDEERLAAIVREPEVSRWWGLYSGNMSGDDFLEHQSGWVIEIDGRVAGWVEFYEEAETDYRHVALDIFLTTALHGQGLAHESLRLAMDHFQDEGHHRFTIDPAAENRRALRSYERLGFRRVGVLRKYERGRNGEWHDNVLMELLAEERPDVG